MMRPGSVPARLAQMQVGESLIFSDIPRADHMTRGPRVSLARRHAEAPDAKWVFRSTNKGVRATRVR